MTCGHLQHRLPPRLLKILYELLGHPTSKETLSSLTKSKDHMKRNIIYSCSKLDELCCDSKIEIEIVAVKKRFLESTNILNIFRMSFKDI